MFPVSTDYGSREQLEVRKRDLQKLVHRVEQVEEQAAREQDELCRQLELINNRKEWAVLVNTSPMKNICK